MKLNTSLGRAVHFDRNSLIFNQGTPGSSFYLILEGTVELQFDGRMRRLLKAGDFFGEISLLTGLPRTATAQALTSCELLELRAEEFQLLMNKDESVREEILNRFKVRLLHSKLRKKQGMLTTSDSELESFLSHFKFLKLFDGDFLFRRGDEDDRLFLVLKGSLKIIRDGFQIANRGPGSFIGEISALSLVPRTASVQAEGEVDLLYCRSEQLLGLLKHHKSLEYYLRELATTRLLGTPNN